MLSASIDLSILGLYTCGLWSVEHYVQLTAFTRSVKRTVKSTSTEDEERTQSLTVRSFGMASWPQAWFTTQLVCSSCVAFDMTMSTMSGSNLMPTWQAGYGWPKLHLDTFGESIESDPCPAHMVKLASSSRWTSSRI